MIPITLGKQIVNADAGDNQKVIEGAKVTLEGNRSKIVDHSGLRYLWKQVNGPKVRISDANSVIASFEAPKVPSGQDKITLKFVLLITEYSEGTGANSNKNNNNDKDSITVTVEQEPSLDNRVSHEPSNSNNNNNNNKDTPSSQHEGKVSSNDPKNVDDSDIGNHIDKEKSEDTKNEESVPSEEKTDPSETQTEADTNSGDSIS